MSQESSEKNRIENGGNFFERIPRKLELYKIGEPLKRENFTDFLIKSFAVSKGATHDQVMYFVWASIHNTKNDVFSTLLEFYESGGWDTLSEEEKSKFYHAFLSVPKHKKVLNREYANYEARSGKKRSTTPPVSFEEYCKNDISRELNRVFSAVHRAILHHRKLYEEAIERAKTSRAASFKEFVESHRAIWKVMIAN